MSMNEVKEVWYDKTVEQAELRFKTDRGRGLAHDAIPKIRREFGSNTVYGTGGSDIKKLIPTDFTALMLLAAVFTAMIFDVPIASGAIVGMMILNYAAALFTYFKAQKVLSSMTAYSLPTAKVLRGGKPSLIDMRALVPGDVIFLSAGDIVPADCRLFMTDGLMINEGTLTGIQSSVAKDSGFTNFSHSLPLDRHANVAFATTIVTAGHGRGIVVATGKNTAACQLDKAPAPATHENLKILGTLKKYCSVWSLAMLALVFAITLINLFVPGKSGIFNVFLTGISLAAAAMSEFYVAFGYIIVGCGIFGAMKRRRDVNVGALIKNPEKLEALSELTTLIVPKDGIITSADCVVDKIYTSRTLYSASDIDRVDKLRATILSGVISTGIYGPGLSSLNSSSRRITPEEEAIISAADALHLYNSDIDRMHPILEHMPSGGASKFETTLTVDSDKRYLAVCRGDAQSILDACEYYTENGGIYRMTTEDRLEFLGAAQSLTKSSYRVAAVATGQTGYNNLRRIGSIQSDLTFEGFIAIREPLQPGVAQTIARCKAAGIRVIMTTDRYAENDKYLAMAVGIIENERGILTGVGVDSMHRDLLRTNLPLYNMYAGISTAQMADIVKMMRADGERVGLLSGGINGALLLKRADVGFTRSITISPKAKRTGIDLSTRRSGAYSSIVGGSTYETEALKFISDVVVSDAHKSSDGGFAAVVSALEYSRTVYLNLLRMVRYLTTTQLSRIFIVLGSMILGTSALTPIQLIFSGLVIDLAAILASAFAKPPHNVLAVRERAEETLEKPLFMNIRAVLFALLQAISVLAMHPLLNLFGFEISPAEATSAAFVAFCATQLVTFAELASEKSIFSSGVRISVSYLLFALGVVGFTAAALLIPGIGATFGVVPLSFASAIACAAAAALTLALNEIYKRISRQERK